MKHHIAARPANFLFILIAFAGFSFTTHILSPIKRHSDQGDFKVSLPLFIQVGLAGGDRYLAANVTVFRVLMVNAEVRPTNAFDAQAKAQMDAGWLNPRHEDNYYLAAAFLPWNGQLSAAQNILEKASRTRPFDMMPPFFYGFNRYYFENDPISGAEWLNISASHAKNEKDRLGMNGIAAAWVSKGQDRHQALKMLLAMASQSRYPSLKRRILLRAERLRYQIQLDEAIEHFRDKFYRNPSQLDELVTSKILPIIPEDPLGQGFIIDQSGKSQIKVQQK